MSGQGRLVMIGLGLHVSEISGRLKGFGVACDDLLAAFVDLHMVVIEQPAAERKRPHGDESQDDFKSRHGVTVVCSTRVVVVAGVEPLMAATVLLI